MRAELPDHNIFRQWIRGLLQGAVSLPDKVVNYAQFRNTRVYELWRGTDLSGPNKGGPGPVKSHIEPRKKSVTVLMWPVLDRPLLISNNSNKSKLVLTYFGS